MVKCQVVIPGIGQCEVDEGDHEDDGHGRLVHVKGAVKWNGHENIEVTRRMNEPTTVNGKIVEGV